MKRVGRCLFLLLTILSLSGTAQAVPTVSNLWLNPGFEYSSKLSGNSFDLSWDWSGGYCSDWFLVSENIDLHAASFNASLNIGARPDRDFVCSFSVSALAYDSAFEGASGNDGYPSDVPEPDTMMLLGSGLLALAGIGRRFTRT